MNETMLVVVALVFAFLNGVFLGSAVAWRHARKLLLEFSEEMRRGIERFRMFSDADLNKEIDKWLGSSGS